MFALMLSLSAVLNASDFSPAPMVTVEQQPMLALKAHAPKRVADPAYVAGGVALLVAGEVGSVLTTGAYWFGGRGASQWSYATLFLAPIGLITSLVPFAGPLVGLVASLFVRPGDIDGASVLGNSLSLASQVAGVVLLATAKQAPPREGVAVTGFSVTPVAHGSSFALSGTF